MKPYGGVLHYLRIEARYILNDTLILWRRLRWHAWNIAERATYALWLLCWRHAAHLDGAVWVEVEPSMEGREN